MQSFTVRSIEPQDREFLYQVYASTRQEELAVTPWDEAQKESFLRIQFEAQHKFYQDQYPGAQFQIIAQQGQAIGRLYWDRREEELRLMDIALLPPYRNQGIGSKLLKQVLDEAQQAGLPVRLHVERRNRARRLYQRLGFREVEDNGVHCLMEWHPAV